METEQVGIIDRHGRDCVINSGKLINVLNDLLFAEKNDDFLQIVDYDRLIYWYSTILESIEHLRKLNGFSNDIKPVEEFLLYFYKFINGTNTDWKEDGITVKLIDNVKENVDVLLVIYEKIKKEHDKEMCKLLKNPNSSDKITPSHKLILNLVLNTLLDLIVDHVRLHSCNPLHIYTCEAKFKAIRGTLLFAHLTTEYSKLREEIIFVEDCFSKLIPMTNPSSGDQLVEQIKIFISNIIEVCDEGRT